MPSGHEVELVDWSRTSRAWAGFLWYVALPFTLVNVAGAMGPGGPSVRARVYSAAVHVASAAATVASLVWLLVLTETILRYWPIGQLDAGFVAWMFIYVAIAVIVGIVGRATRRGVRALGYAHATLVLLATLVIVTARPATRDGAAWLPDECSTLPTCADVGYLNVPVVVSAGTVLVAAVMAGVCWRCARGGELTRRGSGAAPALALVLSLTLIHLVWGLLRNVLDWVLRYLRGFHLIDPGVVAGACGPPPQFLTGYLQNPGTWDAAALPRCERVLLPYSPSGPVVLIDTVPVYALTFLLGLVVVALMVTAAHWLHPKWLRFPDDAARAVSKAVSLHRVVADLPGVLSVTLIAGGALGGFAAFLVQYFGYPDGSQTPWVYALATIALHAAGALTLVVIAVRARVGGLSEALSLTADVLAFWPVESHPLSGRSYRDDVVRSIRARLRHHRARPVAVVGHSQGSVIAAWVMYQEGPRRGDEAPPLPGRHLVTCGSPLVSLYATFFPHHFGREFFARARCSVGSWKNYWRTTDPIATRLDVPDPDVIGIGDLCLADVRLPLHKHGGYWLAPEIIDHVASVLDAPSPSPCERKNGEGGI